MLTAQGVSGGFDLWKLTCWARTYWHRLLGTASSWFVWDFAFYGNKLFQGTFIAIINPGASLIQVRFEIFCCKSSCQVGWKGGFAGETWRAMDGCSQDGVHNVLLVPSTSHYCFYR